VGHENEAAGAGDATRKACSDALYAAVLAWARGCGRNYFLPAPSQFSTTVTGADRALTATFTIRNFLPSRVTSYRNWKLVALAMVGAVNKGCGVPGPERRSRLGIDRHHLPIELEIIQLLPVGAPS